MVDAAPDSWPNRVHDALSRPGLVGLLALIAGHGISQALDWSPIWWLWLLAVSVLLLLVFKARSLPFVLAFCVLVASVGGWQSSRIQEGDALAASLVTQLADGGAPLGEVRGSLARMPARSNTHWTLTLAPGGSVDSRGMSAILPAPIIVRIRGNADIDNQIRPLIPGDVIQIGRAHV